MLTQHASLLPDEYNLLFNCVKLSQQNLKNHDAPEAKPLARGLERLMKGMRRGRNIAADSEKIKLLICSVDTALQMFEECEEWRAQFQSNELDHEIDALKRLRNKLNPPKKLPFGGTIRRASMAIPIATPKEPTEDAPPKIALKRDGLWRTVSL